MCCTFFTSWEYKFYFSILFTVNFRTYLIISVSIKMGSKRLVFLLLLFFVSIVSPACTTFSTTCDYQTACACPKSNPQGTYCGSDIGKHGSFLYLYIYHGLFLINFNILVSFQDVIILMFMNVILTVENVQLVIMVFVFPARIAEN